MRSRRSSCMHAALAAAVLCLAGHAGAQQLGPRNLLARTACAAEVHCPADWISRGITPTKVQLVLGQDQAAARQRLLQTSALWSDQVWRCAALGQDCPAGTTQRSAQIMIPLSPDALRAVQQVLAGGTPPPIPTAPATRTPQRATAPEVAAPAGAASLQSQDQSSAACFNPDLFKPGTQYRHHSVGLDSGGNAVHFTRDITISDNGSFAGVDKLIVERGTFEVTDTPGALKPDIMTDYYSLEQTPDGPVYYRHGSILRHESIASRYSPAEESETSYTPPVKMAEFAMQPGQSYRFVGSATSISREPGQAPSPPESKPHIREVTYVGRKQVHTEAGTFDTCHLVVNGNDHHYIVGMGLPLRLGQDELQADSHVNNVPLSAWAR